MEKSLKPHGLATVLFMLAVLGPGCEYSVTSHVLVSNWSPPEKSFHLRGRFMSQVTPVDGISGSNTQLIDFTRQLNTTTINESHNSSGDINHRTASSVPHAKCRISPDDVFNGSLVNCSNMGLTYINSSWFPGNTSSLLLDGNNFTILKNDSFKDMVNLIYLSIRYARVNGIQKTAFRGLYNLTYLDLEGNKLALELCKFKKTTFQYVPNLTHLYIAFNTDVMFSEWSDMVDCSKNKSYDKYIDIFQFLHNLTSLSIDTFTDLYLRNEFTNFTQLTWLKLYCAPVRNIYKKSFEGLAGLPLKTLELRHFSNLLVPNIHQDAFQYVRGLEKLVISQCEIGNQNVLKILSPFLGGNLTTLVLNDTKYSRYGESPDLTFNDGIIRRESTKIISQLCLQEFVLSNSKIFAIENGAFSSEAWQRCLRVLDVSGNNFGFSAWRSLFFELHLLKNLDDITVTAPPSTFEQVHPNYTFFMMPQRNNQNSLLHPNNVKSDLSKWDFTPLTKKYSHIESNQSKHFLEELTSSSQEIELTNKTSHPMKDMTISPVMAEKSGTFRWSVERTSNGSLKSTITPIIWFRMPPMVRVIRMAYITLQSFIQFRSTWKFVDAENIEEIYALDIPFLFYCRGRLLGLERLKVLDVSGSMMDVEDHFYDDLPGLRVLVLSSILPVNYFENVVSCRRLLRNLTLLTYLDLSNNGLNSLLPETFSTNGELSHLILARNRFSSIPFEFHTTPKLSYLDMTENAVPYLEEKEMSAIDAQIRSTGDFTLKLHGNAIVCLCSTIKFLDWLHTTQANLDYGGNYTCTAQDGQITSTGAFSDTMGVWRQCVGSFSLMVSLIIATMLALTFVSVYLLMRFKTSLITFVLNILAPQFNAKTSRDYKTDVFIGYADDDYRYIQTILKGFLEDDLGVTTFIHQRDLGVGFTDQLFYEAIQNSWRVLLVLTATFLHNYVMADIVMKYASHSVTPVNQGRVFVLLEESQVQNIPSYLHDVLDDTRIIIIRDLGLTLTYEQQMSIKHCLGSISHRNVMKYN